MSRVQKALNDHNKGLASGQFSVCVHEYTLNTIVGPQKFNNTMKDYAQFSQHVLSPIAVFFCSDIFLLYFAVFSKGSWNLAQFVHMSCHFIWLSSPQFVHM